MTTTKKIKKNKKNTAENTALPPTRRKSQRTKLEAAGMRQCNRSTHKKWAIPKVLAIFLYPLSIALPHNQFSTDIAHFDDINT